jgi:hypothetical protein
MYCGEHFRIEEEPPVAEVSIDLSELTASYQAAFVRIEELINHYDKLLPKFTSDGYRRSFEEYAILGEDILRPIDQYTRTAEELWNQIPGEISEELMTVIERNIASNKGFLTKQPKSVLIDQHRFFLAVYLIPMLSYLKLEISDALAERIIEDWKKRHPKCEFKKSTYDELASGFIRKGFCFITSAVCDTLNKADDCYELESFRQFRDQYLLSSEAGQRQVEEYYRTAPRIVAYLNMQPDSEERYQKIWKKYLKPCLKDIERGRNKRCRNRYVRMVQVLSSQVPR